MLSYCKSLRPGVFSLALLALVLFTSLGFARFPGTTLDSSPPLEHFQKVRTIQFSGSESLLIATINHLDVGPDGQLLVVDQVGRQALLFDAQGTMLKELDPSICHPGFHFRPLKAVFAEGYIFLINSLPWGYRFKLDGECLGSLDDTFIAPDHFDFDASGDLYGIYERPEGKLFLRHMDPLGKMIDEAELPPSKHPYAEYRLEGGGVIIDGAHIFYAPATAQHVLKLTRDGAVTATIAHRNSWFRSIKEDLPPPAKPTPDFFKRAGRLFKNSTITESIFALSDQHFMVQYRNGDRGFGYQVFTRDGDFVVEETGIDFLFKHAEGGLAYRVVQPELDEQGELPNPYLEVYRFVEP